MEVYILILFSALDDFFCISGEGGACGGRGGGGGWGMGIHQTEEARMTGQWVVRLSRRVRFLNASYSVNKAKN